uniref:TNF receptor superfamily member 11a n=1 Tax=Athene cunicularia TaxID=194338 RepID=A0A663MSV5_ATHCN
MLYIKTLSLQITPPCESEQHYEYSGRCCTKCEPGKYMSARCTGSSDSVCQPCGPNEYMDVWNEEDKCLLHKICDQGKALREVNPGNSTFQRQCACTMGYHWNEDCDCCQRNSICAPGFGAQHPVQQDKDTMCIPCARGYFSKVASSTDECKSWTNCMLMALSFLHPAGTNRILYLLIVILFFVALIGIVLMIFMNVTSAWRSVHSDFMGNHQIRKPKSYSGSSVLSLYLSTSEGTGLLGPTGSPAPGKSCCSSGHAPCRNGSPGTAPCEVGGSFQEFSVVTETQDDHFPTVPTEDEYMDKDLNTADYLSLLSRTASKTVSSFSEPMEAGENDSLNQYFSGIGSTEDVSETGNKDTDRFATNYDSEKICVRCGISYRESPRKWSKPCCAAANSASTSPETGSYAQCICGLNFLSAGQRNVTGNSNSTFISSGQVMNFKGDIIVVYLSQNSQEGPTASGPSEENVGSPVQEENLSRCETFAGNGQHYKEKCAERGPSCHGQALQPVQEEGKLGHFSEKVLN